MRHDDPDLRGSFSSEVAKPRTLLETVDVTSALGGVTLTLPASPWSRFVVEIDNWVSTADSVVGAMRFGTNGTVKAGASDYAWANHSVNSIAGNNNISSNGDTKIELVRDAVNFRFGNEAGESWSFEVTVEPGSSVYLPKCWWRGSGFTDDPNLSTVYGGGVYKDETSSDLGRADSVQFFNLSDTIAAGTFRLYGLE